MRRQPCCGGFICVVYLVGDGAAGRQLRPVPRHRQGVPGPCHFCHEHGGLRGGELGPRRGMASMCWGYCEISQ